MNTSTRLGKLAVLLVGLFLMQRVVVERPTNVFTWDGFGYWLYLPLTFIHDDLGMRDPAILKGIFETHHPSGTFYQAREAPTGNMVIRSTPGLAIIHLPGFLVAHAIAGAFGYPADGFSTPYQYSALLTYLVVVVLGLWVLRNVLDQLFGPLIALVALLMIVVGTNLLVYMETNPMMTHGYAFALFSLLLWLTMKWHERPHFGTALAMGAVLGLLALMRPTDALAVLIPLLWPMRNLRFPQKILALIKHYKAHLLLALLASILACSPAFVYWKRYAGSWLWDSYQNPGEGLDLLYPHIHQFLFSFRKGWLIYSPLVVLALFGLGVLWKSQRRIAFALILFLVVDLYVVSSWTAWWYPGAFGQRGMIQAYPVLAIGLAGGIAWLGKQTTAVRWAGVVISGAVVVLSLHQSHQSRWGIWDYSRGTYAHYKAVFFDTRQNKAKKQLLLIDRSTDDGGTFGDPERYRLFRADIGTIDLSKERTAPGGRTAFLVNGSDPYTPALEAPFSELTPLDHAWLKVSAQVWCDSSFEQCRTNLVATFDHGGNYKYEAHVLSGLGQLSPGQWNTVEFDYLTPEPRRPWDKFRLYAWYEGGAPVWVDSIRVQCWVRTDHAQ